MSEFSWNIDLNRTLERISRIATGPANLSVVNTVRRVAFALPQNREVGHLVLELYQPQRLTGKLFKAAVDLMNRWGYCPFCTKHNPHASIVPAIGWLGEASRAGSIGFLGCNPSHGPRCILVGIMPDSGETFIAKLGLDESAHAVEREYQTLKELSLRYPGVAAPAGHEQGSDWFLMRLPHLGSVSPHAMSDPGIRHLLDSWAQDTTTRLGANHWASDLIHQACVDSRMSGWHAKMEALVIRNALIHGDFAIWNLRYTNDGIRAIDWEWAEPDGIAGIDLVHGLRQEAYMIRKLSATSAIAWILDQARSSVWSEYLAQAGWSGHLEDWLRLGLLHSHYNARNDSKELLEPLGIYVES